jgi:H2-forming N5,N10-methylenetetrahydromethanopterin dehydrogenase-like enzyme
MEPKFQTSFIPKKPIGSSQGLGISVIRGNNILSVIATVVFIVTVLTAGSLFFYKNILINQVSVADKSVIDTQIVLGTDTILKLVDLDTRIKSARILLEKHAVVSKVLLLMEGLVLKKMRFNEFSYKNLDNKPSVSVSGEIQTYNALAGQQEAFLSNPSVKNPEFSNFNLADNGYIVVKFSADIDPNLISYKTATESTP